MQTAVLGEVKGQAEWQRVGGVLGWWGVGDVGRSCKRAVCSDGPACKSLRMLTGLWYVCRR